MSKTIQELTAEMTKGEFIKYCEDEMMCPMEHWGFSEEEIPKCEDGYCNECCIKAVELRGLTFKQPIAIMEEYLPVLKQLQEAETQSKRLDEQRKVLKEKLQEVMEEHGVTKWENEEFSITYVAEGKPSTTLDSTAVKKKYPMIYEECSKPKAGTKAYVKFAMKK